MPGLDAKMEDLFESKIAFEWFFLKLFIQGVPMIVYCLQNEDTATETTQGCICLPISRLEGDKVTLCTDNGVCFRVS